jgi:hypothetical protein
VLNTIREFFVEIARMVTQEMLIINVISALTKIKMFLD